MEIKVLATADIHSDKTDALVVFAFDGENVYHDHLQKAIDPRIADGSFKATEGSTFTAYDINQNLIGVVSTTGTLPVLYVGMGKRDTVKPTTYKKAHDAIASYLTGKSFSNVFIILPGGNDDAIHVKQAVDSLRDATYSFNNFKSKAEETKFPITVSLVTSKGELRDIISTQEAINAGMAFTKDLGNTPPNICTPTYLADQARTLISERTNITVLGLDAITELGMGSFLSVAQGSSQEPQFIVIRYMGADDPLSPPVALVGKGITFDTGGISIKPSGGMQEMKFDMMGAASVLGTIKAIDLMGLNKNVVGIIPTCENMPSHNALKPGDIVTSMSGKTIEIINTDAEGRLILCDALTYAQEKLDVKPEVIIDLATLTGAILVALGDVHTGMFTTDETLTRELVQAGQETQDTVWLMPMDDAFDKMMDSSVADMLNSGGRYGGSSSAARFLSRFVGDTPWVHLDIAGTASTSGSKAEATGRPVPLLVQYLMNKSS